MIIKSDWHIHTEHSYDATLPLDEILENSKKYGFEKIGITDHMDFPDKKFLGLIKDSADHVHRLQKEHPNIVLGVELTPIERPEFEHALKAGTRDGYVPPKDGKPYDIALALTKEELLSYGIRYGIGAAHWRVDVPHEETLLGDVLNDSIKEWYRQQMYLACDDRVTILGHPWYIGSALWYDDFSVIPKSMNQDIGAALKENKKYVECNPCMICSQKASEKFRRQYGEFLRELFEMGIPVTYGSDAHRAYSDVHLQVEERLALAGFKEGDIVGLSDDCLW